MPRSTTLALLGLLIASLAPFDEAGAIDFSNPAWYAHGAISIPFGDFGDFAGTGFGGGVGASVPHQEALNFRGEAGFFWYSEESSVVFGDTVDYSTMLFPFVALAEYTVSPDSPVYVIGGVGIILRHVSVDFETPFGTVDESDTDTEIGLVGGGGFRANEQFSIEARLNLISDTSHLTLGGTFTF
jgi:hypothetical protein